MSLADYTSGGVTNWGGWLAAINTGLNGYVPVGTFYIRNYSHGLNEITAPNVTICGDGPSSVIQVITDSTWDISEYAFLVKGDNVTITNMKVSGSGRVYYANYGQGSSGIMFETVNRGVASNLTVYKWGFAGIYVHNSTNILVRDNEVNIDGCFDPNRPVAECGMGAGISVSNDTISGNPDANNGYNTVWGNRIVNAQFEGIYVVSGRNTIMYNRIERAVDGIVLQHSGYNLVRNNTILNTGGPSFNNPPRFGNGGPRWGFGIFLNHGVRFADVVGNVIENMTSGDPWGVGDFARHGIHTASDAENQFGNRILANTVRWASRPTNLDVTGIWNGTTSTGSILDFNVVSNAPLAFVDHGAPEVRENNLSNNDRNFVGDGVRTCNRINGIVQSGCNISCYEGSCTFVGSTPYPSLLTGENCTGNEYVRSGEPGTWNATGKRGTSLQGGIYFSSYRDVWGYCYPLNITESNTYRVYR